MERQPLTNRQKEILEYMDSFTRDIGYPPTVREICKATGLRSPRSVSQHLQALERKGYIERGRDKSRAIRFLYPRIGPNGENVISMPLMGKEAVVHPTMTLDGCEATYTVDRELFDGAKTFMMRVHGDCCVGAHIVDGDLIVVDPERSAVDGDVVAVAVGSETAVGCYETRDGNARVNSGNGRSQRLDLTLPGVRILGKVVGVIRKLV